MKIAVVSKKTKHMSVITENRLMLSKLSSSLTINFLLSTLRDWLVRLEAIALPKPNQLKEASVKDANATPPTMGTREKTTHGLGLKKKDREKDSEEGLHSFNGVSE